MKKRTWFITGVSSGFGYELTRQLLEKGEQVIGTVRNVKKIEGFITKYPENFHYEILDVTDIPAIHRVVNDMFEKFGQIDVVISNAGYGLYGCAEELSDEAIDHIIATNLTGSIQLIKSMLPHLRNQGGGRIIQVSSYAGQVAFPATSMYNATKFGIEGFCEAVAEEVKQFNIGITIAEPGGARTEFRYGSVKVGDLMPEYKSCHDFLNMLDPSKGLAPGNPVWMAQRMIESVDIQPAPLRMVFGSQALSTILAQLKKRIADYETQTELAASTDFAIEEAEK